MNISVAKTGGLFEKLGNTEEMDRGVSRKWLAETVLWKIVMLTGGTGKLGEGIFAWFVTARQTGICGAYCRGGY